MASEDVAISTVYCTIIDTAFIPRAVTLQRSIAAHNPAALFAYYCTDEATAALLKKYISSTVLVKGPTEFETEELQAARRRQKLNEFCWTCKPAILINALQAEPSLDWAVWLDADMMAFADLDRAFDLHPHASVLLTPHDFSSPRLAEIEPIVGRFNAGYAAFRNDSDGRAALDWWMGKCLEGCPAIPVDGRYADQKYLDDLPRLFQRVAASDNAGLNSAPWNAIGKCIDARNDGQVTIAGEPLLLYHFQGLKVIRSWLFDLYGDRPRLPKPMRDLVYKPYMKQIAVQTRALANDTGQLCAGIDAGFHGWGGFVKAGKRLLWSSNLVFQQ